MVMTMKNTMRAVRALLATLRPNDGPTSLTFTSFGLTPASLASRRLTVCCSAAISASVPVKRRASTRSVFPDDDSASWILASPRPVPASELRAASTRSFLTGTSQTVPPLKSMPRCRPCSTREAMPTTITAPEIMNHSFQRPTKSYDVSPWYSRCQMLDLPDSLISTDPAAASRTSCNLLGRLHGQAAGDAHPTGFGEQAAAPEEDHHRAGEEVGDDHVEQRREPEEEREAAHRSDGEQIEEHGADERRRVGREDRAVGATEASIDRRAHGLARADLVFEPLEVDDVRVHGDADRHDDPGGPRQRQREPARLSEIRDDRVHERGRDAQAQPHHEAERPVVGEHVERHERETDGTGGQAGRERVLAERGRHGLHRLTL